MRSPKYPPIGSKFKSRNDDLVVVIKHGKTEHRTGPWAWTPYVGYRFLTGHMKDKTGSAGLGDFRSLFKEVPHE